MRLLPWMMTIGVATFPSHLVKVESLLVRQSVRATWQPGSESGPITTDWRSPWSVPFPPTDSVAVGGPTLFACFSGTTRLSDFPETCLSALRHLAFSDRSLSKERD